LIHPSIHPSVERFIHLLIHSFIIDKAASRYHAIINNTTLICNGSDYNSTAIQSRNDHSTTYFATVNLADDDK